MDEIIITTPEKIKQIVENCLIEFHNKNMKISTPNPDTDFLKSIKDISRFLGCSTTTAQKFKNEHKNIFIQIGRKFLVRKNDVIEALKI